MKIFSWNVNGLRAVQKKGFVQWVTETQPDILCLQETKATIDQLDDAILHIEGYRSYFNSAEKKGYSGVAVYTKKEPLSIATTIGHPEFENEGRIQVLEYQKFTLLNIYFPNGQMSEERLAYKLKFYDAVLAYCDDLLQNGKNIIMCGDYNTAHKEIDLKNPKANEDRSGFLPVERAWLDTLMQHGFIDTFRHFYPQDIRYSWWTYRFKAREKNVGWRIDYFFVNKAFIDAVADAEIHTEVIGSDHCPVSITI